MGNVANSDKLQLLQEASENLGFVIIPTTPDNTPEDIMSDSASEHVGAQDTIGAPSEMPSVTPANISMDVTSDTNPSHNDGTPDSEKEVPHREHHEPVARHIFVYENHSDDTSDEDPYSSLDPNTTLTIPITNPTAFPIQRLQEVQSQHYPSTHITNMLCHKTPSGPIIQVTADIQDGSINHLFIRDPRLISALDLTPPDFDTINLDTNKLRLDETFTIRIFPDQRPQKLDEWIMGELVSARHAYLYWLDERRSADPKAAPYAAEAKAIARKTGRRWMDVMREVEGVWRLEQGRDGRKYRENRARNLGEDPVFPVGAEEGRVVRSMFG